MCHHLVVTCVGGDHHHLVLTVYIGWLKEKHPEAAAKSSTTSVSGGESLKTHVSTCSLDSATSSQVLSDILVFPEPAPRNSQRKRKPGINARAICLSDINTLQELKEKENEKKEAENEKIRKMEALQEKRMQRQLENEKKAAAREEKRKARIQKKNIKEMSTYQVSTGTARGFTVVGR